ncbi:MAG: deoxyribodipyrimidine photo-lyase [Victivallaceae bacterium]|nr:deoxyribodipyrimidine photo-lyase [Victivallaceae bacterium]
MIHRERLKVLNGGRHSGGGYVLYWMQASQRAEYNHALEFAVREANKAQLPLLVCFGITERYPNANLRHYRFMLEGLKQTAARLKERGINFIVRKKSPEKLAVELSADAALTVFDAGYLPLQRKWRKDAAVLIKTPVIQVESNVIVPVESVSGQEEYAAYTIRGKIRRALDYFMQPLEPHDLKIRSGPDKESIDINKTEKILASLAVDKTVAACENYHPGGADTARKRLELFICEKLPDYSARRNDPALDFQSGLSPYLHFGQLSPLETALKVKKSDAGDTADFLEELIVRRELAVNFAFYNAACRDYSALPPWAKATLREHSKDRREYIYSLAELEQAATHDPYWNAAQTEMLQSGKMHGYMRMYWGKMLLQWSATPETAFQHALLLNDKYELDGRDPNGCAGIAWCFGKHDRPWPEHKITGKVRLMNQNGLKRKFDADKYVEKIRGDAGMVA